MSDPIPGLTATDPSQYLATSPIDGLTGSADPAREFESILLGMLVKEMRESLPGDGLFGKSPGASVLEGLFDQMMGESLASGEGLGLRRNLFGIDDRATSPSGESKPLRGSSETTSVRP